MMNDLISRQAAIDALQKEINKGIPPFDDVMGSIRCGVRLARNIIEDLPSAQPTVDTVSVKHGRWTDKDGGIATCSVCGDRWGVWSVMKYCPSCGAKMEVTT